MQMYIEDVLDRFNDVNEGNPDSVQNFVSYLNDYYEMLDADGELDDGKLVAELKKRICLENGPIPDEMIVKISRHTHLIEQEIEKISAKTKSDDNDDDDEPTLNERLECLKSDLWTLQIFQRAMTLACKDNITKYIFAKFGEINEKNPYSFKNFVDCLNDYYEDIRLQHESTEKLEDHELITTVKNDIGNERERILLDEIDAISDHINPIESEIGRIVARANDNDDIVKDKSNDNDDNDESAPNERLIRLESDLRTLQIFQRAMILVFNRPTEDVLAKFSEVSNDDLNDFGGDSKVYVTLFGEPSKVSKEDPKSIKDFIDCLPDYYEEIRQQHECGGDENELITAVEKHISNEPECIKKDEVDKISSLIRIIEWKIGHIIVKAKHNDVRANDVRAKAESVQTAVSNQTLQDLKYQQVLKDGQCLFHAVGLYLGQDAESLRQDVADHLKRNINEFEPYRDNSKRSFEQHIDDIRNGKEWGDHIEIEAIQRIINRPIIIIRPDSNPTIPDNISDYDDEPIFIYYNGHNHYDGLIMVNPSRSSREILNNIQQDLEQGKSVIYSPSTQLDEHSPKAKSDDNDDDDKSHLKERLEKERLKLELEKERLELENERLEQDLSTLQIFQQAMTLVFNEPTKNVLAEFGKVKKKEPDSVKKFGKCLQDYYKKIGKLGERELITAVKERICLEGKCILQSDIDKISDLTSDSSDLLIFQRAMTLACKDRLTKNVLDEFAKANVEDPDSVPKFVRYLRDYYTEIRQQHAKRGDELKEDKKSKNKVVSPLIKAVKKRIRFERESIFGRELVKLTELITCMKVRKKDTGQEKNTNAELDDDNKSNLSILNTFQEAMKLASDSSLRAEYFAQTCWIAKLLAHEISQRVFSHYRMKSLTMTELEATQTVMRELRQFLFLTSKYELMQNFSLEDSKYDIKAFERFLKTLSDNEEIRNYIALHASMNGFLGIIASYFKEIIYDVDTKQAIREYLLEHLDDYVIDEGSGKSLKSKAEAVNAFIDKGFALFPDAEQSSLFITKGANGEVFFRHLQAYTRLSTSASKFATTISSNKHRVLFYTDTLIKVDSHGYSIVSVRVVPIDTNLTLLLPIPCISEQSLKIHAPIQMLERINNDDHFHCFSDFKKTLIKKLKSNVQNNTDKRKYHAHVKSCILNLIDKAQPARMGKYSLKTFDERSDQEQFIVISILFKLYLQSVLSHYRNAASNHPESFSGDASTDSFIKYLLTPYLQIFLRLPLFKFEIDTIDDTLKQLRKFNTNKLCYAVEVFINFIDTWIDSLKRKNDQKNLALFTASHFMRQISKSTGEDDKDKECHDQHIHFGLYIILNLLLDGKEISSDCLTKVNYIAGAKETPEALKKLAIELINSLINISDEKLQKMDKKELRDLLTTLKSGLSNLIEPLHTSVENGNEIPIVERILVIKKIMHAFEGKSNLRDSEISKIKDLCLMIKQYIIEKIFNDPLLLSVNAKNVQWSLRHLIHDWLTELLTLYLSDNRKEEGAFTRMQGFAFQFNYLLGTKYLTQTFNPNESIPFVLTNSKWLINSPSISRESGYLFKDDAVLSPLLLTIRNTLLLLLFVSRKNAENTQDYDEYNTIIDAFPSGIDFERAKTLINALFDIMNKNLSTVSYVGSYLMWQWPTELQLLRKLVEWIDKRQDDVECLVSNAVEKVDFSKEPITIDSTEFNESLITSFNDNKEMVLNTPEAILLFFTLVIEKATSKCETLQECEFISKDIMKALLSLKDVDNCMKHSFEICIKSFLQKRRENPTADLFIADFCSLPENDSEDELEMPNWLEEIRSKPPSSLLRESQDKGDSFFDALVQCINQINNTNANTLKSLKDVCGDYCAEHKKEVVKWDAEYFKDGDSATNESTNWSHIQGRIWIEGRILCKALQLDAILVITLVPCQKTGQPIAAFQLVTKDSCESITAQKAQPLLNNPKIPKLLDRRGNSYFEPWPKKVEGDDNDENPSGSLMGSPSSDTGHDGEQLTNANKSLGQNGQQVNATSSSNALANTPTSSSKANDDDDKLGNDLSDSSHSYIEDQNSNDYQLHEIGSNQKPDVIPSDSSEVSTTSSSSESTNTSTPSNMGDVGSNVAQPSAETLQRYDGHQMLETIDKQPPKFNYNVDLGLNPTDAQSEKIDELLKESSSCADASVDEKEDLYRSASPAEETSCNSSSSSIPVASVEALQSANSITMFSSEQDNAAETGSPDNEAQFK